MCHKHSFTQDEINSILDYINDETGNQPMPDHDTVGNFQAIYFSLQRKLAKQYEDTQKEMFRLKRRLERIDKNEEKKASEGVFNESGLDSLEVADVLLYHLKHLKTYKLTKNKFMGMLFHVYCSWLGSKKERICMEHPVATEWGPQFWRVYKRLDLSKDVPYSDVAAFKEKRSDIAAYLLNAAHKYYDCKEKFFSETHLKCMPYTNALPHNNSGKWNKEISDSDIFLWMNNPQKA